MDVVLSAKREEVSLRTMVQNIVNRHVSLVEEYMRIVQLASRSDQCFSRHKKYTAL